MDFDAWMEEEYKQNNIVWYDEPDKDNQGTVLENNLKKLCKAAFEAGTKKPRTDNELAKENETLRKIINDTLKITDLCSLCCDKGLKPISCLCETNGDCLDKLVELYGGKK